MAEMKHTPGPWSLSEKYHSVNVRAVDGPYVADCNASAAIGWETKQANAHLISAAPDMLAALKTLDSIERGMQGWHEDAKAEAWAKARAAIAKAEGRDNA
jgi:hypothetical protein